MGNLNLSLAVSDIAYPIRSTFPVNPVASCHTKVAANCAPFPFLYLAELHMFVLHFATEDKQVGSAFSHKVKCCKAACQSSRQRSHLITVIILMSQN